MIDATHLNDEGARLCSEAATQAIEPQYSVTEHAMLWYEGEPPFPQNQEWFIAETIYDDRVVLKALPEDHAYAYTTADETHMLAKNVKRWMQFPDSEYIAPEGNASTAATQPEQAKPGQLERYLRNMASGSTGASAQLMRQAADEIADLRAALAIPASTARYEAQHRHENGMLLPWSPLHVDSDEAADCYMEHGARGNWRKVAPASTAASEQQTGVSEADERADFEKTVRSLTHADDESFKRDEDLPDDYADYVMDTYWSIWKRRAALTHRATNDGPQWLLLDNLSRVLESIKFSADDRKHVREMATCGINAINTFGAETTTADELAQAILAYRALQKAGRESARCADRTARQLERAERALRRAGFLDLGGEEWNPPNAGQ